MTGAWCYIPTFNLGPIAAAQLFTTVVAAEVEAIKGIRRGDFRPLVACLGTNVHAKGSLLTADDLLKAATGRPLDTAAFKSHLRARHLDG